MKYLPIFLIAFVSMIGCIKAQPPIRTEELWCHPASYNQVPIHIAISPDGKYASYQSGQRKYCHLLDIEKNRRILFQIDTNTVNPDFSDIEFGKMVFSPDSRTMVYKVFTNRTYINIVSCETGKLLHSFTHDNGGKYIEILSFSPDGSRLAIGSNDSTLYEWDIAADTLTHKYKIFTIPWYDFADYSPDGKYLAVGRSEGEVEVISIEDGKKTCSFNYTSVKGGIAGDISFTTDGKTLMLLGNGSYFFSYWDAQTGVFKRGYKHEVNGFITGFYSGKFADNRKIAITNLYDNT